MFTWKKFLLITAAAAVVGIGSAFGWSYYQANNFNNAAQETINTEAPTRRRKPSTPKRQILPLPPWTARSLNFLTCAAKPYL